MRFSYAWNVTPDQLDGRLALEANEGLDELDWYMDSYVKLRGKRDPSTPFHEKALGGPGYLVYGEGSILAVTGQSRASYHSPVVVNGRVAPVHRITSIYREVCVDSTASRFHGASVAGLVVGAMGVFVLTVALRHWLKECRSFLEDTRGHNQSVERSPSAS